MSEKPKEAISVFITIKDTGEKIEQIDLSRLITEKNEDFGTILINKHQAKQKILGFGGAFTEAAASVYDKLDDEKKDEIIQAYFGVDGNLSLIHI